uniref:Uncharacterized protein n=1 Tax=Ananas comosus var. bracteatus TaxID=296719 RepID=A0A6V7PA47_ANACO|nr:unnamed protein product [Ananas comosus var. bracteatus]
MERECSSSSEAPETATAAAEEGGGAAAAAAGRGREGEAVQRGADAEVGEVGGGDSGAEQAVADMAGVVLDPDRRRPRLRHRRLLPPRPLRPPQLPDELAVEQAAEQDSSSNNNNNNNNLRQQSSSSADGPPLSAASIRKKATEVGARVDALQTAATHQPPPPAKTAADCPSPPPPPARRPADGADSEESGSQSGAEPGKLRRRLRSRPPTAFYEERKGKGGGWPNLMRVWG